MRWLGRSASVGLMVGALAGCQDTEELCPVLEAQGFVPQESLELADPLWSLAVGDLLGDPGPELLLFSGQAGDATMRVLSWDGEALDERHVQAAPPIAAAGMGDVEGDGDQDVFGVTIGGRLVLLRQDGGAYGEEEVLLPGVAKDSVIAIGDINEDGVLDVGLVLDQQPAVLLSEGPGYDANAYEGLGPEQMVLRDLDIDGHLDLITVELELQIRMGDGTGSFSTPTRLGGNQRWVQVVDMDGDEILDLVTSRQDGRLGHHSGLGDGSFRSMLDYGLPDLPEGGFGGLAVGQLDDEGLDALAVFEAATNDSALVTVLNAGRAAEATDQSCVEFGTVPHIVDLDEDGSSEIVLVRRDAAQVEIYGTPAG